MRYDVVCLGDLVADLILPIPQLPVHPNRHQMAHALHVEPGGAGSFAIMAARLGLRTAAIDRLGDDPYGRHIYGSLAEEGVDVTQLQLMAGKQSTLVLTLLDDAGQHVFIGLLGDARLTEVPASWTEMIRDSAALYLNGYVFVESSPARLPLHALAVARDHGVTVYFDPGPLIPNIEPDVLGAAMRCCQVLLLTLEEASLLTEGDSADQVGRRLLAEGPELVVIKMGAEGCMMVSRAGSLSLPPFEVAACDTTGAGDAFDAACVYGMLRGMPLEQIGRLANATGALATTRVGGGRRLPSVAEVQRLLGSAE